MHHPFSPASLLFPDPAAARHLRHCCCPTPPTAAAAMAVTVLTPRSPQCDRRGGEENAGGSYKVIRSLGQGGYGAVSLARHVDSGELVAVKSSLRAGGGEAALLREAAMLAACAGNPAVVQLIEVVRGGGLGLNLDDDQDQLHLVMEYVAGRNLDDVLASRRRRRRPFSEHETRRAMAELLAGVATMHAHGVVHRDLKPGNVLVGAAAAEDVGGFGRLRICDLGLATSSSSSVAPSDTHTDADLEGTPGYMAPELLLGEKDCCGTAVDAWALGCIMAELVAGEPLFSEEDVYRQLISVVDVLGIPDDVSLLPLGVSSGSSSKLRELVTEERLSSAGFDVLKGLLEFNAKDRLTAAAALKMPWFQAHKDG